MKENQCIRTCIYQNKYIILNTGMSEYELVSYMTNVYNTIVLFSTHS